MAVCALTKAFQLLKINKKEIISMYYSTQTARTRLTNIAPCNVQLNKLVERASEEHITFSLRSIAFNYKIPKGDNLPLNKIIENPFKPDFMIENPIKIEIEKNDIIPNKIIDTPKSDNIIDKQAHRMIKIRKKKMKKHKRKKWLKKFKHLLIKKEQRKRIKKEKIFQSELQAMITKAEEFDAEKYVAERIELLTRERLPNKWQGHYVTEDLVKTFIAEKKAKMAYKHRLRTYRLKLDE